MTRLQKMVGCICILSLVLAGLWWYWERPMPLNQLLPKEQWVRMQLEQMLLEKLTGDMAFAEPPLEDFLENLPSIRVNRAEKNPAVEDESFRITLYKGEAWPTVMYVSPSGRISIAADMQFDDWKAYEGGEALYQYLYHISRNLSGVIPVENT